MKKFVLPLLCSFFIACSHQPAATVVEPEKESPFESMVWYSDSTVLMHNNRISIDMAGRFAPYPAELSAVAMQYNPSVIYLAFVEVADTTLAFSVSAYVQEQPADLQYAYDNTVHFVSDSSVHQVVDYGMLSAPKHGSFYKVSLHNGTVCNTSVYLLKDKYDTVLYEFKLTGGEATKEAAKEYLLKMLKMVQFL